MASNAGYFFKCPMCNNKDDFAQEMSKFGVFIPEQDAAWEREGNTYEEIYERHGTCNAEECQCPGGRQFDEDYTIWEIVGFALLSRIIYFHDFFPTDFMQILWRSRGACEMRFVASPR